MKYLLIGGYIRSRSDSNIHYVSARKLLELYRLDKTECELIDIPDPYRLKGLDLSEYITLHPREDGDYRLKSD